MKQSEKRTCIILIFNNILITMPMALNAFSTESLIAKITFTVNVITILIMIVYFVKKYEKRGEEERDK